MTHIDEHGNVWIVEEPPGKCELCGAVEETRPYGPGRVQICFACGEKNPEERDRQYELFLSRTHARSEGS